MALNLNYLGGAINGAADDSQQVYKPKPAVVTATPAPSEPAATPQKFLSSDALAMARPQSASGGIFKDGNQPTGPTGEYLPRTADTERRARTGGGTFDPGITGNMPDFNPVTSALARATAPTTQPPVVGVAQAPGDAAAQAELAKTMTDLNNTSNPQSPLHRPPVPATAAPAAAGVTKPSFGAVNAGSSTASGMPGSINDANVADVLKNHSAAAFSAPGTDNAAAVANLLARTPTMEQGADQIARNQATLSRDVGFNMDPAYMAQQQAKSDLGAIAMKDPRSAAGIAARNASIDAGSTFGTRASRATAYNDTMKGLVDQAAVPEAAAALATKESGDTQRAAMVQAGDTARSNIAAHASMYDADVRRPEAKQVLLADGTLGMVGSDNVVRPAVGTDGKPVRPAQTKPEAEDKRANEMADNLAKTAADYVKTFTPPGKEPSDSDVLRSRIYAAQQHGLPLAKNEKNGSYKVNLNGKWQDL